jgi:hypothetical protein
MVGNFVDHLVSIRQDKNKAKFAVPSKYEMDRRQAGG